MRAGENRGKRLEHDFVVREWIGPIGFGEGLKLEHKRALPLLPNAKAKHLGVAAFVQNRSNSEVLQALISRGRYIELPSKSSISRASVGSLVSTMSHTTVSSITA